MYKKNSLIQPAKWLFFDSAAKFSLSLGRPCVEEVSRVQFFHSFREAKFSF